MTRKNIFEFLKEKYNIPKEVNKIVKLYNSELLYCNIGFAQGNYTPEEIFERELLKNWKQRGSYLNCKEIKEALRIPKFFTFETPIETILNTLEYYENISYLLVKKLKIFDGYEYEVSDNFKILLENIQILLNYLNYEHKIFEDEEKVILIPKNPAATAVAEISDEETAMAILMYNHHTLKGDLERKRQLLNLIQRTYEPLLKNPIEGYNDFFKKTNLLLNNLHIRHNNFEEENNKNLVIDIDDKTLEHWYDELYQLLLFCVLIDDNLKRKKEAGEFLKQIKQGA